MTEPFKGHTVEEIERALEAALLAVSGRATKVSIKELVFDAMTSRVDIKLSAWDNARSDPWETKRRPHFDPKAE